MINVPLIKSVESALSVYYTYPQLKNAEIKEVFGHLSNAKVCQLKELAREKMNELVKVLSGPLELEEESVRV